MDLLGPFPPATGQRKYLIVAVDYFTKWIEAEPLATISDNQVKQFIWKNIITRFGVPRVLLSDNGRQFDSKPTKEYCSRFGIATRFSAIGRPQTNGQAEAANKVIVNGIKKQLEGAKLKAHGSMNCLASCGQLEQLLKRQLVTHLSA